MFSFPGGSWSRWRIIDALCGVVSEAFAVWLETHGRPEGATLSAIAGTVCFLSAAYAWTDRLLALAHKMGVTQRDRKNNGMTRCRNRHSVYNTHYVERS